MLDQDQAIRIILTLAYTYRQKSQDIRGWMIEQKLEI
jgi:hypothetical protein